MHIMFRMLIACGLAAGSLSAQHGVEGLSNPYTSAEDVAAGGRIFRSHCAVCHGLKGEGDRGPAIDRGEFRHGSADQDLFSTISEGIPGTEMSGIFYNGRQMWQIVAFVRSLSEGQAAAQATGDPARGAAVFSGKGGCGMCHMVDGEGSRSGPDLSDIGTRRSLSHLQAAVLRPNEKVLPQHWFVNAVAKDGTKISGMRLNEDTHSIQLLSSQQRLVSLLKSELREWKIVKESTMPSYEGRLSGEEVDDLVAYLARRGN